MGQPDTWNSSHLSGIGDNGSVVQGLNETGGAMGNKTGTGLDMSTWNDIEHVFKYGIFVIASFGTIGNLLSLIVLSRKCFRTTTTSIFLRVLAVFDTLTLWSYIMWDIYMYFKPDVTSVAFCKILNWIMASAPHVASYTLLTVTLERLIAVISPLKVHLIFTRKRAVISSALVIATPCLYNSVYFCIITVKSDGRCGTIQDVNLGFMNFWKYYDSIIGVIIPAILIFILNITTTVAFHRAQHMRKAHVYKTQQADVVSKNETKSLVNGQSAGAAKVKVKVKQGQTTPRAHGKDQAGNHLTVMLILVSLFYWILMLPSAAYFIAQEYATEDSITSMAFFHHVVYLLMLTNSALDFFLYVVTARKFRQELWKVFARRRRQQPPHLTTNAYAHQSEVTQTVLSHNGRI